MSASLSGVCNFMFRALGVKRSASSLEAKYKPSDKHPSLFLERFDALDKKKRSGEIKSPNYRAVLDELIAEGHQFNPLASDRNGRTEAMEVLSSTGLDGLKTAIDHGLRFNPDAVAFGDQTEADSLATHYYGEYAFKLYANNIIEGYEGAIYKTDICDNQGRNLVMQIAEEKVESQVLEVYATTGGVFDHTAKDKFGRTEAVYIAEYVKAKVCSFSDIRRGEEPPASTRFADVVIVEHVDADMDIDSLLTDAMNGAAKETQDKSDNIFGRHVMWPLARYKPFYHTDFTGEKPVTTKKYPDTPSNNRDLEGAEGFRVFLEHGGQLDPDNMQEAKYFMQECRNSVTQELYKRWFLEHDLRLPLEEKYEDAPTMEMTE